MTDYSEGDTLDVDSATGEHELHDWGQIVDGRYTYEMVADGERYLVAISEYEIVEEL